MFKKELKHRERYFRDSADELKVETSLTIYEVYVETRKDKDGKVFLNRDNSERLFAINDDDFTRLENSVEVKVIREGLYKPVYRVEEDIVERNEKDGKRMYFVIDPSKVVVLEAGTQVLMTKSGLIKIPTEVGYALVDDTDPDNTRLIAVRKFATEDHAKEAEQILVESKFVHRNRE